MEWFFNRGESGLYPKPVEAKTNREGNGRLPYMSIKGPLYIIPRQHDPEHDPTMNVPQPYFLEVPKFPCTCEEAVPFIPFVALKNHWELCQFVHAGFP